ncbi:MAG: aminopeptidase, partial [Paraprevotella sp.]|nr:aminopeptidase [Paraprevotella sp.]
MKRISYIYAALSLCCATSFAQQALTPEVLKTLADSYQDSGADKAIRNAVNANPIKKLTENNDRTTAPDTWFSNQVNSSGITDQKKSGRCWLFTGTNILRAKVMARTGMKDFYLSTVYDFFYDQLEKSNLFLQSVIDTRKSPIDDKTVEWLFRNPLSDGGQFTGISDLIGKYGVVPKEVMAETYSSDNTPEFSKLLISKLREDGILLREAAEKGTSEKELEKQKVDMMKTVYRMLVYAYGEPTTSFIWAPKVNGKYTEKPKTYTPQSFYREVCGGEDMNANYVMLMNDPSLPFNQVYEIDYDRHTYAGHTWLYINLPSEDIKD